MAPKAIQQETFTLEEIEELFEEKFSIDETAKHLHLDPSTVGKLMRNGKLGHYRCGGRRVAGKHHIAKYLSRNKREERKYNRLSPAKLADSSERDQPTS